MNATFFPRLQRSESTLSTVWNVLAGPARIRKAWREGVSLVDDLSDCRKTRNAAAKMINLLLRVSLASVTVFVAISFEGTLYAGGALALCAVVSLPAVLSATAALAMYKAVTIMTAYVANQSFVYIASGLVWAGLGTSLLANNMPKIGLGESRLFPAASRFLALPVAKLCTIGVKSP